MSIRCSCGEINKDGARFCNGCGGNIERATVSDTCPSCGHENFGYIRNCAKCGILLRRDSSKQTIPGTAESPEDQESWSKTYGIPGFYESSVSEGPSGAQVQTRFSALGYSEVSTYPRWMITSLVWGFLGLLVFAGLVLISAAWEADRTDFVILGFGVLGSALLGGYLAYTVYYKPPRRK